MPFLQQIKNIYHQDVCLADRTALFVATCLIVLLDIKSFLLSVVLILCLMFYLWN